MLDSLGRRETRRPNFSTFFSLLRFGNPPRGISIGDGGEGGGGKGMKIEIHRSKQPDRYRFEKKVEKSWKVPLHKGRTDKEECARRRRTLVRTREGAAAPLSPRMSHSRGAVARRGTTSFSRSRTLDPVTSPDQPRLLFQLGGNFEGAKISRPPPVLYRPGVVYPPFVEL